jgi:alkanesulfonate monooxygenase SsuD/methylene tetrahydromethanopterin reductase-like flavin-dependent oxidoreductase (luciferase family)
VPATGHVPLSVLDLAPLVSGSTAADALRNTIDLARHAERLGYARYWLAEHHLTPGVAAAAPAVLIGLVAAATERIRVGSGAVQTSHHRPVVIAEQFGTLAHIHPGRIDLGLGRSSIGRLIARVESMAARAAADGASADPPTAAAPPAPGGTVVDGLLIPALPRTAFDVVRVRRMLELVGDWPDAAGDYGRLIREIQAFVRGDFASPDGMAHRSPPAEGADFELWILASSAGESAQAAGELGLPLAANYHVAPWGVLETVEAYRAAFRPSDVLAAPHVMVSADVVVAEDDESARRLAAGYGPWVHSIRFGGGAMPYPTEAEAAAYPWTKRDRDAVADRVDTQFVGSPRTVVDRLATLRDATAADEVLVTTITHDHADRVRSFELLARAWADEAS